MCGRSGEEIAGWAWFFLKKFQAFLAAEVARVRCATAMGDFPRLGYNPTWQAVEQRFQKIKKEQTDEEVYPLVWCFGYLVLHRGAAGRNSQKPPAEGFCGFLIPSQMKMNISHC